MIALTDFALVRVEGHDVAGFLQGQVTCDVRKVSSSAALLGGYCNIQGRLMAVFYLVAFAEGLGLILPRSLAGSIMALLEKYGRFSKIRCSLDPQPLVGALTAAPAGWLSLPGSLPRCLHLGPVEGQSEATEAWQQRDLTEKLPWIFPETQDYFLPHTVNLPDLGAVAFDKGCYLGQEIIARMHYRGQVRKHSYCLQGAGPLPAPGTAIEDAEGKEAGRIVYACPEGAGFRALASLVDAQSEGPLCLAGSPVPLHLVP